MTKGRFDDCIDCNFIESCTEEYPLYVRLGRISQLCECFSQNAQCNFPKMLRCGDKVAARIALVSGIEYGMRLLYELEGMTPPCDKWLSKGLEGIPDSDDERILIQEILGSNIALEAETLALSIEKLAKLLAGRLYAKGLISDADPYLIVHVQELDALSEFAEMGHEDLVEEIAEEEFEEFDRVHNIGGRAFCQDDWETFRIMRISQYDTWTDLMLSRYLCDFRECTNMGRNLIEEKYARMMESTAPDEYERIKDYLPAMTDEQKKLIDAIVTVQVSMMEDFAKEYPDLANRARSIHTYEDSLYNTSYETYLRGELSTYSAQMLLMYGRFVSELESEGRNLAGMIIENTIEMYEWN